MEKILRDEFALILFIGEKRSGKTLSMTEHAKEIILKFPDTKIYSNYWLNPKYFNPDNVKYIDRSFLVKIYKDKTILHNSIILIDELHLFADCRDHATSENKSISYLVGQLGKRKNVFMGSTHFIELVDIRLQIYREKTIICKKGLVDKRGLWFMLKNYNTELTKEENERLYIKQEHFIRKLRGYEFTEDLEKEDYLKASDLFDHYDTAEIVVI